MAEESTKVVSVETHTFNDFKKGLIIENDPLEITAPTLDPARVKAFLENPFVKDSNFECLTLVRINGIVGGRNMNFPVLFKAKDEILEANAGSDLFVHEDFRKDNLALELVTFPIKNKLGQAIIFANFSKQGIAVYKAMRFNVFSLDKMVLVCNMRIIFEKIGMKGALLRMATSVFNIVLKPVLWFRKRLPARLSELSVKSVSTVPEWVDEVVKNDGHQFMEVHDHRWLQWCLDNKFHTDIYNEKEFFIVEFQDKPVGFFMTMKRQEKMGGSNKNVVSIVEWGIKDNSILQEFDYVRLMLNRLDAKTDVLQFYSDDNETIKISRKNGFVKRGVYNIVYRDMTKRFKEAKNQDLWRLRFGYSDSLL